MKVGKKLDIAKCIGSRVVSFLNDVVQDKFEALKWLATQDISCKCNLHFLLCLL
jgi:hypothetical protein